MLNTKNMNGKVLMFHYVRPENNNSFKFLNYFSLEKFCNFLDKEILLDRIALLLELLSETLK